MGQIIRPDSNVTQTNFAGGYAQIDEISPTNSDKAYPNLQNVACTLEVGLGNPPIIPGAGTTTVRHRLAHIQTANGNLAPSGTVAATMGLYQGASLIDSTSYATIPDVWTDYSWAPNTASVTDWTDLRIRLTQTTTALGRGAGISWLEVEIPDPAIIGTMATTEAQDTFAADDRLADGDLAAVEALDTFESGDSIPPSPGTRNVCMRCGFKKKVAALRKEWTGLRVCNDCWDPKPAELKAPRVKPEGLPRPGSNPEPPPVFGRITADQL